MRQFIGAVLAAMTICGALAGFAQAQDEGERPYLWRVQTVRAAPGGLVEMIEINRRLSENGFYEGWSDRAPFIMRHSQGDQWDFMILYPMGGYSEYFSPERLATRREAHGRFAEDLERLDQITSFREDHFEAGPSLERLEALFAENDFYHIEVFHALAGKRADLIEQRRMENRYLIDTGRRANEIFITDGGGDADVMTIGFYKSLQEYANMPRATGEEAARAARAAGFASDDDIGPHLRRLISSHHDTLAVSVN